MALRDFIREAVKRVPEVIPYLTEQARDIALKSQGDYEAEITALVTLLVAGSITAAVFETRYNAIIDQYIDEAWEAGAEGEYMDDPALMAELDALKVEEKSHVAAFAVAIIAAGAITAGIASRIGMWANTYAEAQNRATLTVSVKNNVMLEWVYGDTIQHCSTCKACAGVVAGALEWEGLAELGITPQGADLECGGWRCQCSLKVAEGKRTPPDGVTLEEYITGKLK